jgi:hypothetical protein
VSESGRQRKANQANKKVNNQFCIFRDSFYCSARGSNPYHAVVAKNSAQNQCWMAWLSPDRPVLTFAKQWVPVRTYDGNWTPKTFDMLFDAEPFTPSRAQADNGVLQVESYRATGHARAL